MSCQANTWPSPTSSSYLKQFTYLSIGHCIHYTHLLEPIILLFFQDYVTDVYLRQRWYDSRLAHENMTEALDLADPNLVKVIWKPEVFFPNAKEANFQFVTVPNVLIRIHPDGEILYILR